jgi:hypothetical protein
MVIDDLPTGSLWVFTANCIISFFFQFIGFLLTYLLHTSHAGKYGSRAGLGITLIQFGFYSRTAFSSESGDQAEVEKPKDVTTPPSADELLPAVSSKDWLAFLFMTLGMFKFFLFSHFYPPHVLLFRMVPPPFINHWVLASQTMGKVHSFGFNTFHSTRYGAGNRDSSQA